MVALQLRSGVAWYKVEVQFLTIGNVSPVEAGNENTFGCEIKPPLSATQCVVIAQFVILMHYVPPWTLIWGEVIVAADAGC